MEYTLGKFDNGMYFITPDERTVISLTQNNNKRVICRLNDQLEIHCAIMSKKEGGHCIMIGSTICKKLKLKEGDTIRASFFLDETEYQFEMPEELKAVLDSDEEADKLFHLLTKGNQRGLIYLVAQVKSVDKRIERALKIAARIKNGVISPKLMLK